MYMIIIYHIILYIIISYNILLYVVLYRIILYYFELRMLCYIDGSGFSHSYCYLRFLH